MTDPRRRVILHLDMDAFYAAVEIRDDPSLRGLPLIIGHRGRRGVVSTCSYEARRFGVRSAMPSVTAMRLCPDAVWRPGRMRVYAEVSRAIGAILDTFSPAVEPVSIDEAFLDLTGTVAPGGDGRPVRTLDAARPVAASLKDRIRRETGLTASVGVAPNKFLAKVASDLEKPDGLVVLAPADLPGRLWPLPVDRLWGVGPRTAPRLRAAGFPTIGDVARGDAAGLERLVGRDGARHLVSLSRGLDDREVEPRRTARSISEERTYGDDLRDGDAIDRALLERSEGVARDLRRAGLAARLIRIKVRTGAFTTFARDARARLAARAADAVRARLGEGLITRARLLPPAAGRRPADR